jgi:hypothetical protein
MKKRKSFDEENKFIHPSRKKIIDTVFNRDTDDNHMIGYEGESDTKRSIGEVWTDKNGVTWEQRGGYRLNTTKLDDIRQYLAKLNTCESSNCKTIKYSQADKKMIRKTNRCVECQRVLEGVLKREGVYEYYEDYRITRNQLTYVRELKTRFEEALNGVSNKLQFVNERGELEVWGRNIDVEQIKADLTVDIKGANEAIEALVERKEALEQVLQEKGHTELIKK